MEISDDSEDGDGVENETTAGGKDGKRQKKKGLGLGESGMIHEWANKEFPMMKDSSKEMMISWMRSASA
eukprot:CAMPEP_0178964742 /NCGR_PEP_ID=MMETSP0789-20121207/15858_1 /TAXON_ID=3005 /ORGANISM="Rhizosolenia setigera, Strain CCMP 1694" /LENGTH=68 /DNA_ID=CAMNT_0020649575 /DNA_START=297 /DNA_END=499 /DNA_ORIENTATION=-